MLIIHWVGWRRLRFLFLRGGREEKKKGEGECFYTIERSRKKKGSNTHSL